MILFFLISFPLTRLAAVLRSGSRSSVPVSAAAWSSFHAAVIRPTWLNAAGSCRAAPVRDVDLLRQEPRSLA